MMRNKARSERFDEISMLRIDAFAKKPKNGGKPPMFRKDRAMNNIRVELFFIFVAEIAEFVFIMLAVRIIVDTIRI